MDFLDFILRKNFKVVEILSHGLIRVQVFKESNLLKLYQSSFLSLQ